MSDTSTIKGRFAPTPSGAVHLGTLLAAIGSFLQVRSQGGIWHVRIDDIDPPRVVAGAADSILRTLDAYGLHWDGPVIYQSDNLERYQAALEQLVQQGDTFGCACSRKEIAQANVDAETRVYPGTCRDGIPAGREARAIRLRVDKTHIRITDRIQGDYSQRLHEVVGDFVIRRADGYIAYHLATVVDDAEAGYTEIVRGLDLLAVTPQQVFLQQRLGLPTPGYAHLPLLTDTSGNKLGKSTGAKAVDDMDRATVFKNLFSALGLTPDDNVDYTDAETALGWALSQWQLPTARNNNIHLPSTLPSR